MILHVSSPGTGSVLLLQAMRHPKVSCREDYGFDWRESEQVLSLSLSLSVVEFMSPPNCLL